MHYPDYNTFADRYYALHLDTPAKIEVWAAATLAERARCVEIIRRFALPDIHTNVAIDAIERGD